MFDDGLTSGYQRQTSLDEYELPERRQATIVGSELALEGLHRQVSAPTVASRGRPSILSSLSRPLSFLGGRPADDALVCPPASPTDACKKLLRSVGEAAKAFCAIQMDVLSVHLLGSPPAKQAWKPPARAEPQKRWVRVAGVGDGSLCSLRHVVPPRDAGEGQPLGARLGVDQVITPKNQLRKESRCQTAPQRLFQESVEAANTEDDEVKMCEICCIAPAEVVLLPCRHGGICDPCLRRVIFMRPPHRGGCCCPFCRRRIKEVVRMDPQELSKPAALPRYGYTEAAL